MALQPCMEWVSIKKVNKTGTGKREIAYFNEVEPELKLLSLGMGSDIIRKIYVEGGR